MESHHHPQNIVLMLWTIKLTTEMIGILLSSFQRCSRTSESPVGNPSIIELPIFHRRQWNLKARWCTGLNPKNNPYTFSRDLGESRTPTGFPPSAPQADACYQFRHKAIYLGSSCRSLTCYLPARDVRTWSYVPLKASTEF